MPKNEYVIKINETTRIFVFFENDGKKIRKFVVKLEILINGRWLEIERFDVYHGYVHKDVLDKNGDKKQVIRYQLFNNESGLNMAIKDFKINYELYIWRYFNG